MAAKDIKTFTFSLDGSSDVPLWVQLSQRIRHLIVTGYYSPGERLPSVRALAQELSINYNTINKAYLSLTSEGYLESVHGRGVFVRETALVDRDESLSKVDGILQDAVDACRELGLSLDDVQVCMNRKIRRLKAQNGEDVMTGTGRVVHIDTRGSASMSETGA